MVLLLQKSRQSLACIPARWLLGACFLTVGLIPVPATGAFQAKSPHEVRSRVEQGIAAKHPLLAPSVLRSREASLRKRVEEFYALEQLGHWDRAEGYVAADSQENFRKQPKNAFLGFKVDSVKVESNGREGTAVIEAQVVTNVGASPLAMPRASQWRWINGAWYVVVPNPTNGKSLQEFLDTATAKAPTHPEELKFKGHHYKLGFVQPDQIKVARFPFTNVTDHAVTLTSIETSCPCLQVKSEKKEFKPGESGEVAIEFNPAGYERDYAQTVVVKTDPGDLTTFLAVMAYVMPKGKPSPPVVTAPKNKPGS